MNYHDAHTWGAKLLTGYKTQDTTLPKLLSTNIGSDTVTLKDNKMIVKGCGR